MSSSSGSAQRATVSTNLSEDHPPELSITVLPRGEETTIAVAKIADDGTVVGLAPPGGRVLRWQPGATLPDNLGGDPTFMLLNRLPLISADGQVIATNRLLPADNGATRNVPSTWTAETDWQALPKLILPFGSRLLGMSRNAKHAVGFGWQFENHPLTQPWLWSTETGQQTLPVVLPTYGGEAWAVSDDGRVVVGHQFDFPRWPELQRRFYATRWADGNMRALTDESGGQLGQAFACSGDGAVVVGGGQGGDQDPTHPHYGQAWYWTEESGGVYLGTHPEAAPGTPYYATDVSGDGSVVVGTYYHAAPDGALSYRAFIWTASTGLRSIQELMAEHGLDHAAKWQTLVPTAISTAGDAIVLGGLDQDLVTGGFVLHLAAPRQD